ncbi:MAG: hypothetical protein K8U57_22655 [Planctomycetes bacterium]|nr:hypothetical protein [Planctomycetota bacterium]
MSRYLFCLLSGAVLVSANGCRNHCGSNSGLTSINSRSDVPYTLTGGSGGRLMEGCYDPITGRPVPCPPSTVVIPGGTYPQPQTGVMPRPDELPFPSQNMIPPQGVPFAPPMAAPGAEGASLGPKGSTPVKATPKQ